MKHRGVATSLHPAKEAARAAARAALPPVPTGGVSPAPAPLVVGDWVLDQDPDSGALIARHEPTGAVRELLLPPNASEEGSP